MHTKRTSVVRYPRSLSVAVPSFAPVDDDRLLRRIRFWLSGRLSGNIGDPKKVILRECVKIREERKI